MKKLCKEKLYKEKIQKRDILGLVIYMIVFTVVAAWIAMLQPIEDTPPLYTNPPDEHSRYLIPTYICDHLRLPNGFEPEVQIPYYGGSYALFPGLSYLFMGLMMRLVSGLGADARGMLLAARSVNLIFGLTMAFFVWFWDAGCFRNRGRCGLFAAVLCICRSCYSCIPMLTWNLCVCCPSRLCFTEWSLCSRMG